MRTRQSLTSQPAFKGKGIDGSIVMVCPYHQMMKISYFLFVASTAFLWGCSLPRSENQESHRHTTSDSAQEGPALKIAKSKEPAVCQHTAKTFNCVTVVKVYDGDTVFIDIPEVHPFFGKRMGVRVFGIDTPELRSKSVCERKRGQEAQAFLEALIYNAKRVDIVGIRKDKYFRVLGTVVADGKSVSNELVRRKLAYPYHGEKRIERNWCK